MVFAAGVGLKGDRMTKSKSIRVTIGPCDCECGCNLIAVFSAKKKRMADCLGMKLACEVCDLMNRIVVRTCPTNGAVKICMALDKSFAEWFAIMYPEYCILPVIAEWIEAARKDAATARRINDQTREAYYPKYISDKRIY